MHVHRQPVRRAEGQKHFRQIQSRRRQEVWITWTDQTPAGFSRAQTVREKSLMSTYEVQQEMRRCDLISCWISSTSIHSWKSSEDVEKLTVPVPCRPPPEPLGTPNGFPPLTQGVWLQNRPCPGLRGCGGGGLHRCSLIRPHRVQRWNVS